MDKTTQDSTNNNAPNPLLDLITWYNLFAKNIHSKPAWQVALFYTIRAFVIGIVVLGVGCVLGEISGVLAFLYFVFVIVFTIWFWKIRDDRKGNATYIGRF